MTNLLVKHDEKCNCLREAGNMVIKRGITVRKRMKPSKVTLLKIEDMTLVKTPNSFDIFYDSKPNDTTYHVGLESALKEVFENLIVAKVKRKKSHASSIDNLRRAILEANKELEGLFNLEREKREGM